MKNQTYVCIPSPGAPCSAGADPIDSLTQAAHLAQTQARRWMRGLPGWMDREAFLGEALLAAVVAARSYCADRGTSFQSYAWNSVRRALVEEARRQDPISRGRRARIRAGLEEEKETDQPPLSLEEVTRSHRATALEAQIDPDPGPEARAIRRLRAARVYSALQGLESRDRRILHLRYWEGLSQTAVAREFGVSPQRVQQLERRVLARLREALVRDEAFMTPDIDEAAAL